MKIDYLRSDLLSRILKFRFPANLRCSNFHNETEKSGAQTSAFDHMGILLLVDHKAMDAVGVGAPKYEHNYAPRHILFESYYSKIAAINDGFSIFPKQKVATLCA